jgi:hypothetical protein
LDRGNPATIPNGDCIARQLYQALTVLVTPLVTLLKHKQLQISTKIILPAAEAGGSLGSLYIMGNLELEITGQEKVLSIVATPTATYILAKCVLQKENINWE